MSKKPFYRYFKATSGPVLEELRKLIKQQGELSDSLQSFNLKFSSTGAVVNDSGLTNEFRKALSGFMFQESPNSEWKRVRGKKYKGKDLYLPVKDSCIWDQIPTYMPTLGSLVKTAFNAYLGPILIDGTKGLAIRIHGDLEVVFLELPWKDISDHEIKEYEENTNSFCAETAFIINTRIHDSLSELKQWEYYRDVEKWNED
ncbi:hypothetical protein [Pseudoalteromonas luteoviolacea]|uniref:hypothetical protein n=1 Tax=Pseudoalteromonas luteoviolacea TaxID=43657 RepID=UPI001B36A42E|nr:hypothetical protein [Pseudoalteromonas luteoviolacea]MBQ4838803.1 hypothetical protein [Pseudoalteromonas luteoviolacea]